MRKLGIAVAAGTMLLTGCGGASVTVTSPSATGGSPTHSHEGDGAPSGGSQSSSSSGDSSSTSSPAGGSELAGTALAARMEAALKATTSVSFATGRISTAGASDIMPPMGTTADVGQIALRDPLTATMNDGGSRKTDVRVVAGVAYGYYSPAKDWVKQSANPTGAERDYLLQYVSQISQYDPRVVAGMVSAGTAVNKGERVVNGKKTTHWAVTAPASTLMDKQVSSMKAHGCDMLSSPKYRTSFERSKSDRGSEKFTLEVFLDSSDRILLYVEPTKRPDSTTARPFAQYLDYGKSVDVAAPADPKSFADVAPTPSESGSTT